jgi:hypothetical protein
MKRFFGALALTCLLSASALAGEIPTVGAPQPSPQGITSETSPSQIPTVGSAEQISDAALSAILSVLGFLTA